jgi:hypothetical protein
MRWAGHVVRIEGKERCYSDLLGRLEGRRALGSPRFRLEDNIKMDLQDV